MISTENILKNLLLQSNDDWGITNITCDDESEEIHVTLKYLRDSVLVDGAEYPIQDFRHERSWRHLDLWQYKTILYASIPRYRVCGKVKSIEVPWALPASRLSWLMEKKR